MNNENIIKPHRPTWKYVLIVLIAIGTIDFVWSIVTLLFDFIFFTTGGATGKIGAGDILKVFTLLGIPLIMGLSLIIGPLRILKKKPYGKLITIIGVIMLLITIVFLLGSIGSIHEM
ncbi:MAG: hypothetical protein ABR875_00120 [Minisyncoccia bacterium]|jgi:amino acid transporter